MTAKDGMHLFICTGIGLTLVVALNTPDYLIKCDGWRNIVGSAFIGFGIGVSVGKVYLWLCDAMEDHL